VLVERQLPDAKVRDRVSALCVGLAAPCDPPDREDAVAWMLQEKFPKAPLLPFVGIVTHDLEWVGGWSGRSTVDSVVAAIEKAERSPLRPASAETRARLAKLAEDAASAAAKSDWKAVLAASRSASALAGRAPERERLTESVGKAREQAEGELQKAVAALKPADADRAAVRASLKKLAGVFAGEPEAADCEKGLAAIERLTTVDALAEDARPDARAKAAKDFAETRWVVLFVAQVDWK
jgi:hypothetical protein